MIRVTSRAELDELTRRFGSLGGHEPGDREPAVSARVQGVDYDDHGFWPTEPGMLCAPELHIIWTVGGKDVACMNLAQLVELAQYPGVH